MTHPPIDLEGIKKRTEKNANLRSDDFGHDCQKLLEAEAHALQIAADDIAALLSECESLRTLLTEAEMALDGNLRSMNKALAFAYDDKDITAHLRVSMDAAQETLAKIRQAKG